MGGRNNNNKNNKKKRGGSMLLTRRSRSRSPPAAALPRTPQRREDSVKDEVVEEQERRPLVPVDIISPPLSPMQSASAAKKLTKKAAPKKKAGKKASGKDKNLLLFSDSDGDDDDESDDSLSDDGAAAAATETKIKKKNNNGEREDIESTKSTIAHGISDALKNKKQLLKADAAETNDANTAIGKAYTPTPPDSQRLPRAWINMVRASRHRFQCQVLVFSKNDAGDIDPDSLFWEPCVPLRAVDIKGRKYFVVRACDEEGRMLTGIRFSTGFAFHVAAVDLVRVEVIPRRS